MHWTGEIRAFITYRPHCQSGYNKVVPHYPQPVMRTVGRTAMTKELARSYLAGTLSSDHSWGRLNDVFRA
jgi:hypothetical protein